MSARIPTSSEELAEILRDAASNAKTIAVSGNQSKARMGGAVESADLCISTRGLGRVLQYEPSDLTVSTEAGMKFADLQNTLARHRQMIALDPPFALDATVGGVVACNASGPMRRAFGTARDLIIGMNFATLEGRVVRTGGMVVKNVAGLDMGKLMIGSFGTLGIITSVNFRVHSLPEETRTFLFSFHKPENAIEKRDAILQSVLQPTAIDLLSPKAAEQLGHTGYLLAVRAAGSQRVLDRYARELSGGDPLGGEQESAFWQGIREFTPHFLEREAAGIIARVSTPISGLGKVLSLAPETCVARAGSGVAYVYANAWDQIERLWPAAAEQGWSAVIEFAPDDVRRTKNLWPLPETAPQAGAFAMMKRVKQMFDPHSLLNRSRLYGRI